MTFHALLVGADGYFENVLSGGRSYPPLGGCVNDVARVDAMLRARIPEAELAIATLVCSPHDLVAGADETRWPTAANLRAEFARLVACARPGDQVYIHYSGHGGRVSTAWKALKGGGAVDEALVPIDIGRPDPGRRSTRTRPERYLRDVELAFTLQCLAKTGAAVTLVLDACHSGGATRGTAKVARRSAGSLDVHPDDAPTGLSPEQHAAMGAVYRGLHERSHVVTRSAQPMTTWVPPAAGYVLLAGCRDVESALECSLDGRARTGVLTNAFLETLDALGTDQSWQTVYDRVVSAVHAHFHSQTPQLLGDIDRQVFGHALLPIAHALRVTRFDAAARTISIDGGLATTLTEGTRLGIYEPGTTEFSFEHRLARATVTHADALTAEATLEPAEPAVAIPVGAPVVVHTLALRRRVELLARTDLPPQIAARQSGAFHDLTSAIARTAADGRDFLELCEPGTAPHFQVALDAAGHYELCDPEGAPFPNLPPTSDARAAVDLLCRLGRYHTVLEMQDPGSSLAGRVEVELLAAPRGWIDGPPPNVGGTRLTAATDGLYDVTAETRLWLRLTNTRPSDPVNIALLTLGRTWDIAQIIPDPVAERGLQYVTLGAPTQTFPIRMFLPPHVPESVDVFKLFITTGNVDFRILAGAGVTRGPDGAGPNSLGRLIDAICTEHRTRDVAPVRTVVAPWTVRELHIRTRH